MESDRIEIKGIKCLAGIGICDNERGIEQSLWIDVVVEVPRILAAEGDKASSIRFDYAKATPAIRKLLGQRHRELIETVGEEIAKLLLEDFQVLSCEVRVVKHPIGLEDIDHVAFICRRSR